MASRLGDRLLVAAIDFGTAFSGYAFSFKSDPMKIQTNASWSQRLVSLKTPTSVLVDPEGKFDSFGYEAETKYASLLEDESDAEDWALYRKFKMILHNNPVSSSGKRLTCTFLLVWKRQPIAQNGIGTKNVNTRNIACVHKKLRCQR